MVRRVRRPGAVIAGHREAVAIAATLGGEARAARRQRRVRLVDIAASVAISTARLSEIERGDGLGAPLETWIALGIALDRPIAVRFSRPLGEPRGPMDAGHLEIQEHLLGLARSTGRHGSFELPTRPADPRRSTDVGLRDDRHRCLILAECWNTFGDLGAAVRATNRKRVEAADLRPGYRVATVWVVRASEANRRLFGRFPAILRAALPGSSRGWRRALVDGSAPPDGPGLVWFDPATQRLTARRPRSA